MIRIGFAFIFVFMLAAASGAAPVVSERNQEEALRHYRSGQRALHDERFDEAEREFKDAVKLNPTLHLAHYGLGQVYMAVKRYPLAVIAYRNAREAFRICAADALLDETAYERQIDDQIRALEDAKRTFEDNNGPQRKTLDPNGAVQRIDSQINQLRLRRRRNPETPSETPGYLLALGSAYFRSASIADAEREYREAVRVDPELGEAHSNLAVVLMLTGRYSDAESEIDAAEKSGFRVNPHLKDDLTERRARAF